jgi:ankyrin repeat protein
MRWRILALAVIIGIVALVASRRHVDQRQLDLALIKAAFAVDTPQVLRLLKSGASPLAKYGSSGPDHFADSEGGYPMSADKFTALLALAQSDSQADRLPIARALLAAGADINADDGYGDTALAQCCYMNREALALYLISQGANPNTKTGCYIDGTYDIAPAHRATNNVRILKALIDHGADLTVRDSTGDTPLDWAKLHHDEQIMRLIQDATKK